MRREENIQKRILHRFKIAQGHLSKVIEMAESQDYCIDVLHQSQAVQRALREIDNLILANHLKTCVTAALNNGDKDVAIEEVMTVFKRMDK